MRQRNLLPDWLHYRFSPVYVEVKQVDCIAGFRLPRRLHLFVMAPITARIMIPDGRPWEEVIDMKRSRMNKKRDYCIGIKPVMVLALCST